MSLVSHLSLIYLLKYKYHARYFVALKTLLDKVTDEEVENYSGELEVIYD